MLMMYFSLGHLRNYGTLLSGGQNVNGLLLVASGLIPRCEFLSAREPGGCRAIVPKEVQSMYVGLLRSFRGLCMNKLDE
jgi:hypothetical protein